MLLILFIIINLCTEAVSTVSVFYLKENSKLLLVMYLRIKKHYSEFEEIISYEERLSVDHKS
jgi:hypothetical protein